MKKKMDINVSGGSVVIGNIVQGSKNETHATLSTESSDNDIAHERSIHEYDVFISYSHIDEAIAKDLADKIKSHNIRCFLASDEMVAGDNISDKIKNTLNNVYEIMVLVSSNSLKSEWVATEWGGAWVMGKTITPILYGCAVSDLPDRLAALRGVDIDDIDSVLPSIKSRIVDSIRNTKRR